MQVKQVLVVGGGVGGLTLGAALAQRGIGCDVLEVKDEHSPLGVGIIQKPASPERVWRAIRAAKGGAK